MSNQETEHDAFVVSRRNNEYFAYCKEIHKDLIISGNLTPKDVDILGRWIRVSVHRGNSVCRPVRIIDDLFKSRVWNAIPQIKENIEFYGICGNSLKMFRCAYFGFVSDPHNVIRDFRTPGLREVWIERYKATGTNSRWKVSQTQNGTHSGTYGSNKVVQGIVHTYDNGAYYAWSNSEPSYRIYIHPKYCSKIEYDYIGLWVEMEIDHNKIVQSEVIVIAPLFETSVISGFVEISVEFQCLSNSPGLYSHPYFGNICDPKSVLERAEKGAVYSGKIAYHHKNDTDSRWRLAIRQRIYGPLLRDERNRPSNDFNENEHYTYSHTENGRGRDSSPEIVNVYQRNGSRNSGCISPDRGYDQDQYYRVDRANYNDDDGRDYYSNRRHRPPSEFDEKYYVGSPSENRCRSSRSPSPIPERFENHHSPNASPNEMVGGNHFETSEEFKYVLDTIRCDSRASRAPTSDSEDESIDEEKNANILFRNFEGNQEQLTNKTENQQIGQPEIERNNKLDLAPEDKEIIILNSMIDQIRYRFEFFTADEDINKEMQLLGIEEYEELTTLLKPMQ